MPAAPWTDPVLIGRPRAARRRVAHLHFRAAALTPDVEAAVVHDAIVPHEAELSRVGQADLPCAARLFELGTGTSCYTQAFPPSVGQ